MLQRANTDLFNPLVPRAHNSVSKSTIPFSNKANKSQLKLVCIFLFFAPSALMG